jgi:hypothetical protein
MNKTERKSGKMVRASLRLTKVLQKRTNPNESGEKWSEPRFARQEKIKDEQIRTKVGKNGHSLASLGKRTSKKNESEPKSVKIVRASLRLAKEHQKRTNLNESR